MSIHEIYSRRSIRKFLDKDVSIELINLIIDAGRMAPSAKNAQPWRYIVFKAGKCQPKKIEIIPGRTW